MREIAETFAGSVAIAYLRWSKYEQGASLVQQKEVISRWARKNGVMIVEWLTDDGISGTLREPRRPGFGKFMRAIETRSDVNFGVCFDLSRFGRFQYHDLYGYYFTMARDAGKFFYFTEDATHSNEKGIDKIILRTIKQIDAGEKSRVVATGAIRGAMEGARRGRRVAGYPPYGFDCLIVDREEKPVEIHRLVRLGPRGLRQAATWQIIDLDGKLLREVVGPPPKAKSDEVVLVPGATERVNVLVMFFSWSGRDGWGYKRIAAELNRLGIPSLSGSKWAYQTIGDMLKNPAYRSEAVYNRITSAKVYRIVNKPDELGNSYTKVEPEDHDRGRNRPNPKEDWVIVKGNHASPVPQELAAMVDRRLSIVRATGGGTGLEAPGRNPRARRSPALLANFVKCGICGRDFRTRPTSWPTKDGVKHRSYSYACGALMDGGDAACFRFNLNRRAIEEPVLDRVATNVLGSTDEASWKAELRQVLQGVFHAGFEQGRRKELEKQLAEKEARVQALVTGVSPENVPLIDRELTRFRKEVEAIKQEILGMSTPMEAAMDIEGAVDEIWGMALNFRTNFEAAESAQRQRILRPFLRQIMVFPKENKAVVELFKVPMTEEMREHTGRVAPPTGSNTKRSAECPKKTRILRLFYKTGEVVSVG